MTSQTPFIKVFVIADSQEQFHKTCIEHGPVGHNPERLTNIQQLEDYHGHFEVWDSRKLSQKLESAGIETIIM